MTPYETQSKIARTPSVFDMLEEFHRTYGAAINIDIRSEKGIKLKELRESLIVEESQEVCSELFPVDYIPTDRGKLEVEAVVNIQKLTKELADLMYVTIGTAVTFGLPLEEVFAEVHKSNMSKLGEDGKPVYREDGKVLKGPNYKEPDLEKFNYPDWREI